MQASDEQERAARRLSFAWFNEVLFLFPGVSAWVLGVRAAFDTPLGFGYPVHMSTAEQWALALALMLAGIGGAALRASRRLRPAEIARHVRDSAVGGTPLERVELEIRAAQFSVHEVLHLPTVGFLGFGVIFNSDIALMLSIGYSLLVFILMRPDDQRLVRDTMLELQR
ncbi:MAG: hypothetical protein V5A42_05105 [Halofilum sp. (in: g-proteobacteria)]